MSQRQTQYGGPAALARLALLGAILAAVFLVAGCGKSAPTRFYSLTAIPAAVEEAGGASADAGACPSLGIGPVEFPAYLDRTQIVTAGAGTVMHLAEFDQWIEPVRNNFERILMENLSGMVCAGPMVSSPWPVGMHPERQVTIQVRRYDGVPGGQAVLKADWAVLDAGGEVVLWRSSQLTDTAQGPDYAALVDAQSRLAAALARDIAAGLAEAARMRKP
ncbi:PqiC family protein [Desulfolutivibrio sp.]|uniref:PqiC family protein n=1 Tax=Desulfolutivibrio sp. TaxID=2773296 RepID=UPI002F968965